MERDIGWSAGETAVHPDFAHSVRYKTFGELEWYLYRAASAVGFLCAQIFGCKNEQAGQQYAKWLGYAVQTTNIIRDVMEDARMNRIYIPLDDLAVLGLCENDILAIARGDAQTAEVKKKLSAVLKFEAERAREFYAKARAALDPADKSAMFPAAIMGRLYEALLEKIARRGYDVSAGKIRLCAPEKIICIVKACF